MSYDVGDTKTRPFCRLGRCEPRHGVPWLTTRREHDGRASGRGLDPGLLASRWHWAAVGRSWRRRRTSGDGGCRGTGRRG